MVVSRAGPRKALFRSVWSASSVGKNVPAPISEGPFLHIYNSREIRG